MMIDALAKGLWRELVRLDGVERHLWRKFLLRKSIHLVPEALRPVPDGLSPRYVDMGRRFNRDLQDARLVESLGLSSPFLVTAEGLLQHEIAAALVNEQALLSIAMAQ